jgi:hypothetical protein
MNKKMVIFPEAPRMWGRVEPKCDPDDETMGGIIEAE